MRVLTVIAARRGSKGIPGKNWKLLGGKPLISWSLETALQVTDKSDICVTTNAPEVIEIAKSMGIEVPFVRPEHLSTDTASSREAVLHALDEFSKLRAAEYDAILMLQPTSPFRTGGQVTGCLQLFENERPDMVVSAYIPNLNPYYNLYAEDSQGFIHRAIPSDFTRRQDCPDVYALNGSIYVIDAKKLRQQEIHTFPKVKKFVVPAAYGLDLDTPEDWDLAEYLISKGRFS